MTVMMHAIPAVQQKWFHRPAQRSNVKVRLFCLPHAGGSSQAYAGWSAALPQEVEVIPVLLPGRVPRANEPAYTGMEPLVNALAESFSEMLDLPFVFFGHSLGGLIGFELAHATRSLYDIEPECVIVAGCRSPERTLVDPKCPESDGDMIELLRRVGGTPPAVLDDSGLLEFLLPVIRRDFRVFFDYRYVPRQPLHSAIVALGGTMDEMVSEDDLLAWAKHTHGTFACKLFEGDHFFVRSAQSQVLAKLDSILAESVSLEKK
jgi:medium-chain acyl-[acyl-carrier-protein] hydrolase